jgi:hypothetical protein
MGLLSTAISRIQALKILLSKAVQLLNAQLLFIEVFLIIPV